VTEGLFVKLKPILRNIISETQKGFLKGRYIGECTRPVYDLIDKLEEDDILIAALRILRQE
jgi:hypothetical protein